MNNQQEEVYSDFESEQSIDDNEFYKKQLYENFKQTGVLDNLKATLRKQIIEKFQSNQTNIEKSEEEKQKHENQQFNYERKLVGYMIADFFRKHNINYTYSVFLPEMRLESDNILNKREILDALRISPHEYQNLIDTEVDSQLSAIEIVMEVVRKIKTTKKREVHVQTENQFDKPFKQKYDEIEEEAQKKISNQNLMSAKNYEEKLLKYRSDMEKRYQEQLEDEVQKVRDYELAEIRSQEAEQFQQKIRKHKYEMDKMYEEKLVRLKERERTALELCKRRQADLDKIAFEYRQNHIKQIDQLKEKELEMKRHNCQETSGIKEEQEKIKQLEKSLKAKIREYDQAKLTIQTRIEQDIQSRKKLMQKEQNLNRNSGQSLSESNQDDELRRQHRENLQMLETQRQYLQRDLDCMRKDNKELEYIRTEQSKEITALRKNIDSLKESYDTINERFKQSEERSNKLKLENTSLQEQLKETKHFLDNKQNQQIELHRNFSEDIQKYQQKANQSEQHYYNKLQELNEKHRYELMGQKNRIQRLEQQLQAMEDENNNLRIQIRSNDRQQVLNANKQRIEEKINQPIQNRNEFEDLGNSDYKARIQNTQKEFQDQKQKFLEELQEPIDYN